jgi:hypothetical protein
MAFRHLREWLGQEWLDGKEGEIMGAESGRQRPVTRRGLMRGGALGAAGLGVLTSPAVFGAGAAQAVTDPVLSWTNVVDAGADPSGAKDSTSAFQAAIGASLPIYVPPGSYKCNSGPLAVAPWTRIFGNSYGTTTIFSSGAPLFNMDNSNGKLEGVEIDHLTLSATGGDIFSGANIVRSSVHHCFLIQNSAANAIWNCSASAGLGTTYMAECQFYFNREYQYGSPRTINAWYLNGNGPMNINDNWWFGNVCFNQGGDTTHFWYRIIGAGAGQGSRNNRFQKLTFEYPQGGMIRLESSTGDLIEDVTSEDLASLPVGNPLISISTASGNSSGCSGIAIRSYSRRGGNNNGGGITDIQLDGNAVQFIIDTPTQYSGGSVLTIDAGGATRGTLIGSPASYTLQNGSGVKVLS